MATRLRLPATTAPRTEAARAPSPVARAIDLLSDWGVAGFAAWTLLCYLAVLTHAPVSLITVVWLCVLPLLGLGLYRLRSRTPAARPEPFRTSRRVDRRVARVPRAVWVVVSVLCAGVAASLAALRADHSWVVPWLLAGACVAVAVCVAARRPDGGAVRPARSADLVVVAIALGLAALSLLVFSTDGDDPYYVNRAVAAAQLDIVPTRDVVFTHQAVPPIAGAGLPLGTLSVLQGALARLVGVSAGSVAYYVTPPVGTFLAVWGLWRLLRSWAPRRALACLLLGCVYLLFSGADPQSFGNFFLTRMWQGKVVFVAWLVPVLYTYLTAWAARRSARTGLLLVAGGIAGLGLTASATFAVPLVVTAGCLPLVMRREWRALAVPVAALAFPLVIGFIATRIHPVGAASTGPHPVWDLYRHTMGHGVVAAIGGLALWTGPWLARAGAAARAVTGIGVVTVIILTPGLFTLVTETQHIGETLWRAFWVIPAPALVGLLAAVPGLRAARWSGVTAGVAAAGLLVAAGRPIWNVAEVHLVSRPAWKQSAAPLHQADEILAHYDGAGKILAPSRVMRAISLITVRPKAVNARGYYAGILPDTPRRTRERLALTRLADGDDPRPGLAQTRTALADLNVGLVCVHADEHRVVRFVERARFPRSTTRTAWTGGPHPLTCLRVGGVPARS